ncbi:MAG: hypothetical protein A2600_07040 [Candidatus Lambdaproteobacteria bacterium RIFOXYD1_FULL_56_27]|uniref:O-antigen ligase-related domain-containing protein n=1 Tax=Candidatus Lambdaproteobacteria bacterium RIFOXYD2_FULL_56_26 TaxID=1817773 RepID=A0A1F6GQ44_9PROT|nr:MAG: hypothetical protein A2557_05700 [Candidatus Lambdaproteobacteria bacterium RIFOXYD2_FULL_56_26]OGH03686.1 MAG: hypothetical protein A2426_00490 [Candidatus Lambdaproteobacteria bacterium RIFOXYC1_FULL_56_13]OGH07270.1 MAG: hypothetical protein A2600_07040 [Candidatus Lambdaproteobacteria bacterium RIFOXYD1_FULL_56_27]
MFFSVPFSIAGDELAVLLLYLAGIGALVQGQAHWPKTGLNLWLLAVVLSALLAALLAPHPGAGFASLRNLWRFALPFALALALTPKRLKLGLTLMAGTTILVGFYAVLQHQNGIDLFRSEQLQAEYLIHRGSWHAVGAFSHHLTFGGVMLLVAGLLAPLGLVKELSPKLRGLFAMAGLFALYSAYASMGRSIWLGLLALAFTALALLLRRRAWILLVPAALVFVFALWVQQSPVLQQTLSKTPTGQRFVEGLDSSENMDRLLMWQAAKTAIVDHPWVGLGPGQGESLQPYYDELALATGHNFEHPAKTGVHNIFLQNLVDFGLLGTAAFLGWWGWVFFSLWKGWHQNPQLNFYQALRLGSMAGLVGSWSAGFFENNFRDGEVQVVILMVHGLALWLSLSPHLGTQGQSEPCP